MRSYFKEMYCNLDVKYKARRSKKEVKAKSVDTVRELYFKEIKEGRNAFINNTKKIDYLYFCK